MMITNFAIYDIRINGVPQNMAQIVGMAPNGDPPNEYHDQVSWQIAKGAELNPGGQRNLCGWKSV